MLNIKLIVIICLITLFIHLIIDNYSKKIPLNIDVEKTVKRVISNKKLRVKLRIEKGLKAAYDYEKREITVSEGSSVKHVAEVFHELGHAIEDKNTKEHKFSVWQNLLFYLFKYSLPLAVVLHVLQVRLWLDYLTIPTFIFIGLSIWFFTSCLIEEVKASKKGYELIKKNVTNDLKILKSIRLCLYNGLNSYIMLFVVSIMILVSQIIYLT